MPHLGELGGHGGNDTGLVVLAHQHHLALREPRGGAWEWVTAQQSVPLQQTGALSHSEGRSLHSHRLPHYMYTSGVRTSTARSTSKAPMRVRKGVPLFTVPATCRAWKEVPAQQASGSSHASQTHATAPSNAGPPAPQQLPRSADNAAQRQAVGAAWPTQ